MNISNLSASAATYPTDAQNGFQKRAQAFKALANALSSGDLTAAQTAFAALQPKDKPQNVQESSQSAKNNPMRQDFTALANALQSGNLSDAQQAFATLRKDMQQAEAAHGHHHHHEDTSNSTSNAVTTSTTSSSPTSNITSLDQLA